MFTPGFVQVVSCRHQPSGRADEARHVSGQRSVSLHPRVGRCWGCGGCRQECEEVQGKIHSCVCMCVYIIPSFTPPHPLPLPFAVLFHLLTKCWFVLLVTLLPLCPAVQKGDRVYCAGNVSGGYAEYVVSEELQTGHLGDKLTFAQGASVGVPYYTAYNAIVFK